MNLTLFVNYTSIKNNYMADYKIICNSILRTCPLLLVTQRPRSMLKIFVVHLRKGLRILKPLPVSVFCLINNSTVSSTQWKLGFSNTDMGTFTPGRVLKWPPSPCLEVSAGCHSILSSPGNWSTCFHHSVWLCL